MRPSFIAQEELQPVTSRIDSAYGGLNVAQID